MKLLASLKKPVTLTLLLIGLMYLAADYNFRWKNDKWRYAVHTDAADYYRYLPMIFVDHEFDSQEENPQVVKYFCGTAIAYLPFFTIAYCASMATGLPPDGYSLLFPVMISIGTLFYLLAALRFFARFLKLYFIPDWAVCVTLFVMAFGTMIFQYTAMAPGWAHIVAFALCCLILYHGRKLFTDFNTRSIVWLVAAGSLLFFVRPTDILVFLALPFLGENFSDFRHSLKRVLRERKALFTGFALALIPAICQVIIYRWGTGEFLVYSYTKEGFNFLQPEIFNVLFSYSKGLFVYTPILFISLFGLVSLFRRNRFLAVGILLFLAVNTYVIASWWCWNYGASYGSRAFIEHYPLFFLCFAILLLYMSSWWIRGAVLFSAAACIFLNLFQTYQANAGILDHDFKTTKRGYWHVFLRTDRGYSGKFYRFPVDETPGNILRHDVCFNNMEAPDTSWINSSSQTQRKARSGNFSSEVNAVSPYSTGKFFALEDLPYSRNVLISVSGWFLVSRKGTGAFMAISFVNDGKSINYSPFALDGFVEKEQRWEYKTFELQMPKLELRHETPGKTRLEIYLCNNSSFSCFVDDLKIEFLQFRKMERPLDLSWE